MLANDEMAISRSSNLSGQEGFLGIASGLEKLMWGQEECLSPTSRCQSGGSRFRGRRLQLLLLIAIGFCLFGFRSPAAWGQSVQFQGFQADKVTGLSNPIAVAVDQAGNLYVANTSQPYLVKFPAGGGTPTPVSLASSDAVSALAMDANDNLYVGLTSGETGLVVRIAAQGGATNQIGSGFEYPSGIAVDGAGNVFVVDEALGKAFKIAANGGVQTTLNVSLVHGLYGIAADSAGDVFVPDNLHSQIVEIPAGTTSQVVKTISGSSIGAAADAAGNVFALVGNEVFELPAAGGAPKSLGVTGLKAPQGIAVDSAGDLFVVDYGNDVVVEFETQVVNFVSANVCPNGATSPAPCSNTLALSYLFPSGADLGKGNVLTLGAPNLDFTLASGSTCTGQISAGGTCTVNVTFAPKYAGTRPGAVQITDVSGNVLASTTAYGTGLGPEVSFPSSNQTTLASNFYYPISLATDGSGDIYVADYDSTQVDKVPAGGGQMTTIGSGLNSPAGVAVDGAGDVFIADQGHSRVVELPAGGGSQTTVGTNLLSPIAVAVDALGDVFILDQGAGVDSVIKVPADGGPQTNVGSGVGGAQGIAVDGAGNLFVADSANDRIVEFPANGNSAIVVIDGLISPTGVAVDSSGDVYVADYGNNRVLEVMVNAGTYTVLGTGLVNPSGVALDGAGNVYITDTGNTRLVELPRSQPPTLSFDSTSVGQVSTDSPQTVAIANIGNEPLTFSAISFPADFVEGSSLSSGDSFCATSATVGVGETCYLPIDFKPAHSGALSESLTVKDNTLNATNAAQSFPLKGTGVSSQSVSLSATSLSFGSVYIGSSGNSQTVTLTNNGSAALSITSIALTGADPSSYVFANTCGTSLAAGANCTIHGHFAPITAGTLTASVTITDSASTSPQTIALSGTGVKPPVSLSATSLSFGSVNVGSTGNSQTVTLTNNGNSALSITSITLTGADTSSFVFANSCGTSLAAGANCTIHGHFAPTVSGALTAAVTIKDGAATSPQTITLSGTGTTPKPPVTLSATSLSFGTITVGSISNSQTVTMTNTGTAALSITSIAVTGTDASQFVFANSCGTTLAVGANCTIHGHFAPTKTGAQTGTVTITDNASGSPQTIALSGTGD